MRTNILLMNMEFDGGRENYRKHCQNVKQCTPFLKCNAVPRISQYIDNVNAICSATNYNYTPMSLKECDRRMFERNSRCVREWDPYPPFVADPVENARHQNKFCNEFFGKNGCLEQEMSEACGVEVWRSFRRNQLAMNRISRTCNLGF
ncbi:hypothetical protein CAEBREN_06137 [Caenorhabditis brenneri]|uniref:T20D4.11-like domain-containing protein n=1 Tax=Caenorhabditis brenneri TaxID=135651 RepID=G0MA13_CAEBE|nr:hypothetical protein CAEBREN_06137 [Caenorhabditis brenneri]